MMKGNKYGFRRALAIMLSCMLIVGNPALTAMADELTTEAEQTADAGVAFSEEQSDASVEQDAAADDSEEATEEADADESGA